MRRLIAATAAGSLAVAASLFGAGTGIGSATAEVYVVHGVPGLTVDVYVNGALTLDDFQPETVAGPLDLPAGSYDVAITAADAADASSPLLTATADLAERQQLHAGRAPGRRRQPDHHPLRQRHLDHLRRQHPARRPA